MPCSLWPLLAMQLVILPSKIQLLMQLFGEGRIPGVQGAARIVGDCTLQRALCGFCMQGPVVNCPMQGHGLSIIGYVWAYLYRGQDADILSVSPPLSGSDAQSVQRRSASTHFQPNDTHSPLLEHTWGGNWTVLTHHVFVFLELSPELVCLHILAATLSPA